MSFLLKTIFITLDKFRIALWCIYRIFWKCIYSLAYPCIASCGKIILTLVLPLNSMMLDVWKKKTHKDKQSLTLSWRRPLSYRNQSIDLQSKSMSWFLYDNVLRHERVKKKISSQQIFTCSKSTIETLEKSVWNMFKVYNENTKRKSLTSFWCFYC